MTKNIRLGFGVKLLPFHYSHPIRAAEQAATLDLLSGGRADFGTGYGMTTAQMTRSIELFGREVLPAFNDP